MSSSIETIGHKLQSLEERLQAELHDRMVYSPPLSVPDNDTISSRGASAPGTNGGALAARQPPRLQLQTTPNRSRRMYLPVTTPSPAAETDTDKKLKDIMKQTGILTINGHQYPTDIQDLEHLGDLGNGTSGNVVKMRHVRSGTIIAVKQMRRTGNTEENKRILMDLDVVLKSHDCPYIVQCLGCFVRDPDVWICMELMSMCFDKLLKSSKKPVPENILGKITVATVKALSYLKDKHNVIHRDVKPSNILIDERGNIKLCDFGISGRLVDSKANTRSAGCAAYMAPERIDPKKPKYDIRADVWSLGITLVELATARSPYEGCNTDFEVLTKVLDSEPPRLPRGDGFNFSDEFHDFVNKCLTKNHQFRPKYPELLEQPFIKHYEAADVDVPKWFKNIVETSGIKTHHRIIMPVTAAAVVGKLHKNGIPKPLPTGSGTLDLPSTSMPASVSTSVSSSASTSTATNANSGKLSALRNTPISNYQYHEAVDVNAQQHLYRNHLKQDDANYYPQKLSQLPQSNSNYVTNSKIQLVDRSLNRNGDVIDYLGSADSGITSGSSPQSLTSDGDYHITNDVNSAASEMQKLCQRSPFLARKFSNGALKYGWESPKREKESVLSTIGQSIMRNLPVSPFSQKKHFLPQTNQIDPLWQPPTTQDIGMAFESNDLNATPTMAKKKIPASMSMLKERSMNNHHHHHQHQQQQPQHYPQQLPANSLVKNEYHPHRVQSGNHSPIVLQRFYHQQNQLREKECDRHKTDTYRRFSPEAANTLINSYQIPITTTSSYAHYNLPPHKYQHQQSHIPIATSLGSASSSQSTSSQSSTQSSSSQIGMFEQRLAQHSPAIQLAAGADDVHNTIGDSQSSLTFGAFGIRKSADPLQYQPLPQQYISGQPMSSIPIMPEQLAANAAYREEAKVAATKFNKLNVYRASASGTNCNARNPMNNHMDAKENNVKDDHGWFNSLAGAMKRQFASYVKLQLHSSASAAGHGGHETSENAPATSTTTATNSKTASIFRRGVPLTKLNSPSKDMPKSTLTNSSDAYECNASPSNYLRRNNHISLNALDRRHRSPDPPPRFNRGQSPLLLRKNILELSGQQIGSPLLNRRYVSASPPLPPPRRGSESVPGSPQHFRTRIHYTPEPQRRIYRTIDQ